MLHKTFTFVCVVIGAGVTAVHAQPVTDTTISSPTSSPTTEPPPPASASAGAGAGAAQLTLPKGRLILDGFIEINLSTDAVFKPFSISPDLWYGVTDDITVGLVHSGLGATGFIGSFGDALCLTGAENGCPDFYPGFGLDVRYKLKTGTFAWVADGGLYFRSLDPAQLALKLGATGRWQQSDKLSIELGPNLFFGLTNREPEAAEGVVVGTNTEVLNLPITGLYAVMPKLAVALQLGVVLPFQNTGDTYSIPLSIGAHYLVNESLTATAAFSLPAVAGGGELTGFDLRSLTLGGTYAF